MDSRVYLLITLVCYAVGALHALLHAVLRRSALTTVSLVATLLGFAFHTAALALRWTEAGHFPAIGLRDGASVLAWAIVLVFLLVYVTTRVEAASLFAYPFVFGLVFVANLTPVSERADPVLRSLYLPVHLLLAVFGYGALFVAFTMGLLYLFQERELLTRSPRRFYYLFPSLERSDTIGGRSVLGGSGFLTLAIVTGIPLEPQHSRGLLDGRSEGVDGARRVGHLHDDPGGALALGLGRAPRRVAGNRGLRGRGVHLRLGDAGAGRGGGGPVIVVVGLNHETAPVAVREAMAFPKEKLGEALERVKQDAGLGEAMILSTCNRVEVYGRSEKSAVRAVADFLARYHGRAPEEIEKHLYRLEGEPAVRHAFRVAASLDSMVLGEPQILGQVKDAYAAAEQARSLGSVLNGLRMRSIAAAKRARSETSIGRNAVSLSHVAVELATKIFGALRGRSVLLVGAGKMSQLAARQMVRRGARASVLGGRTFEKAEQLASQPRRAGGAVRGAALGAHPRRHRDQRHRRARGRGAARGRGGRAGGAPRPAAVPDRHRRAARHRGGRRQGRRGVPLRHRRPAAGGDRQPARAQEGICRGRDDRRAGGAGVHRVAALARGGAAAWSSSGSAPTRSAAPRSTRRAVGWGR